MSTSPLSNRTDAILPDTLSLLRAGLLVLAIAVLVGPLAGLIAGMAGMPASAWRLLFIDARQWHLFLHSLLFSGTVALTTMTAGLLAVLAMKRHPTLNRIFRLLLPPLLTIPPYLFGMAWATCFFAWNGALARAGLFGFTVTGWVGSWAVESMALLPMAVGFAFLGLESLNPSLLEAARLHRPEARVFVRIGLPLALPALGVGGGFLLLMSLMDYSIPSLFATNVYAMEIFSRYSADGEAGAALLTALPLLLVTALLLVGGISPLRHAATLPWRGGGCFPRGAVWPHWLLVAQYTAIGLLLAQAVIPAAMMCWMTASSTQLFHSLHTAQHAMWYTLGLAGMVVLIGVPLALALSARLDRTGMASLFWWSIILLPLALPASLLGIGMAQLVNLGLDAGVNLTPLAPLLANLARFLPVATLILFAQRLRCDRGLLEAMHCFQPTRWQGAWCVQAPMMAPGIVLAATLLFTLTLSELGATLLVAEPGFATLMMRLYNLLHYGASREVAALCMTLMGITLALGVLATWGAQYRRR